MPDPEALARQEIDRQLGLAGWVVQDRNEMNLFAGTGVAIREVSIPGAGEADYLLVAERRAVGIIEAKPAGVPLTGVEIQTRVYADGMTGFGNPWLTPLPMLYESTGFETRFTCLLDPEPRSRPVFSFHRPETLAAWAKAGAEGRAGSDGAAGGQTAVSGRTQGPQPYTPSPSKAPIGKAGADHPTGSVGADNSLAGGSAGPPVRGAFGSDGADHPAPAHVISVAGPGSARTGSEWGGRKAAEEHAAYRTHGATLAGRWRLLPATVDDPKLWDKQRTAITNLEHSLRENRPRALIQMATGSGKTFTAISAIYRMIRHADARRVLFLVDRANLGRQTFNEFQQFTTPDDGRKFTELYNVQHLRSNTIDTTSARVCISTIQRIYSILMGQDELDESLEEGSVFEGGSPFVPQRVTYNPSVPIETFDVIVIDEAHRSIYNLWRQVLEYFDATLIGLTATPNKQAFGFFNQNLVMEYTHEEAVADGVNVPYEVYPIRTKITSEGSSVEAGYHVDYRDKKTRQKRWQALDEDLTYTADQLDREVVAPDQIRTVIRTFRDRLPVDLFPGRTEVPKTLIFAKDDTHADDIVQIVREEFGKGNDFCQKITYRTTGIKPEQLLAQFRNNYNPRIVVTVDMIATGTDVKPIEIVIFMRTVKSAGYFEQMKGRGVRVMPSDDLQRVTSDAPAKTHFVIVDAVGVTEREMVDAPPPMERKRSVGFAKLIEQVAWGASDPATLSSLAYRLSKLDKVLGAGGQAQVASLSGGTSLAAIVQGLIRAADPDAAADLAREAGGLPPDAEPDPNAMGKAQADLAEAAIRPIAANAELRNALIALQARSEQVIDTVSKDELLEAGFSAEATERSRALARDFRAFIETHRDEITCLELLYSRPAGQGPSFRDIKALAAALAAPPRSWSVDGLWRAYQQLEADRVRGSGTRVLTDLVSLVRFAMGQDAELVPFRERALANLAAWMGQQEANGVTFTAEQRTWLELIRDHIASSYRIEREDFDGVPFSQHGGLGKLYDLFGEDYTHVIDELNEVLAA